MKRVIAFSKRGLLFMWITLLAIAGGGALTYYQGGFDLGIDFSSGITLQVEIGGNEATVNSVRETLSQYETVNVQQGSSAVSGSRYIIKVSENQDDPSFREEATQRVVDILEAQYGLGNVTLLESAYIGPRFSANILRQFFTLTMGAFALIMLYVWFRFKFSYALAALAALAHDVLFMVAFMGAFQIEVSTTTVAAILTVVGYSLNDTIVIFDRIRENQTLLHEAPLDTIVDTSISQSLSRTIITSLTTLLAVVSIYIFSSGAIQYFALNMIVGVVIGTFSSIFVASTLLTKQLQRAKTKSTTVRVLETQSASAAETRGGGRAEQSLPAPSKALIAREIEARRKILAARQSHKKKRRR